MIRQYTPKKTHNISPEYDEISARLEKLGVSQFQFSKFVDISPNTLGNWKTRGNTTFNSLRNIKGALDELEAVAAEGKSPKEYISNPDL